jgi:hypothetical protein
MILFTVGIALVLDSAFGEATIDRVIELLAGLLLLGVIPIDVLIDRVLPDKKQKPDQS